MLSGSPISFCDKQAFNITDENLKKILDVLKNDYFITIKIEISISLIKKILII